VKAAKTIGEATWHARKSTRGGRRVVMPRTLFTPRRPMRRAGARVAKSS